MGGDFWWARGHTASCQFTLLSCPKGCKNEHGITNRIMKKDLDEHLASVCTARDYKCKHCGEQGTFINITEVHDLVCKRKIVNCPNAGCSQTIERSMVESHIKNDCSWTLIPCKYESFGCLAKISRHDAAVHESDAQQHHLDMVMSTTVALQLRVAELENTVALLVQKSKDGMAKSASAKKDSKGTNEKTLVKEAPRFVSAFSITKFSKKVAQGKQIISQPFYTCESGYCLAIEVDIFRFCAVSAKNVMSVYVHVRKGRHDSSLTWPLIGEITVMLLNQLADKDHYSGVIPLTADADMRPGKTMGFSSYIPHDRLAPNSQTLYLKNDTLLFRVYFK